MIKNALLMVIVGLMACVWALIIGINIEFSFFRPLSFIVGLVGTLLALYNRYVWKWPLINKLHSRPLLMGTYKGKLHSSYINPETQEGIKPIETYIVILQTYSGIVIRQFTKESTSYTVSASINHEQHQEIQYITGLYRNEPTLSIQGRSPVHYGGLKLDIIGTNRKVRLKGSYWTDRKTIGDLEFEFLDREQAKDFKSAKLLA